MCGIAGRIHFNSKPVEERMLDKMEQFLTDRGPDENGTWIDRNIGFKHARLSIIDISKNANQPMSESTGKAIITYNGEIYNYLVLQKKLKNLGCTFKTQSDTEVILNGYLQWGIESLLKKLDGMFAFVLYDKTTNIAYACRDRFGKKPLYYFYNLHKFSFSSDIRSIWATEPNLTLDYESLDYYLTELSVPQPKTIWNEIKQVQPAHFIKININRANITEQCFWKPDFIKKSKLSLEETEQLLEEKLKDSILKRMVGDVPVACFLSGGADSGLITAILASNSSQQINTFSVGVSDSGMNELPLAKELAERYKTNHTEITIEPDITGILPKLIEGFGEPFADSSSIPSYYISMEMSKQYKVALSGDGGDELFGGYYDYRWAYLTDNYLLKYPNKIQRTLLRPLNYIAYRSGITDTNSGLLEHYSSLCGGLKLYRQMGFHPKEKSNLYHRGFSENKKEFALKHLDQQWREANQSSITDTLFEASFKTRLLNDYLVKVDRTSMMNSLEIRSPFLDYKLAEFASTVPNPYKFKNGIQKYLLKKIATKYIDKDFFQRKKKGFGIPMQHWLRKELKELTESILLSTSFKNRKIFNDVFVSTLLNEHIQGKADNSHKIWALVCLELWFQKFINK